jgi:hypothetical protein
MPRLKSKDLARIADHEKIRGATKFYVNWFIGRDRKTYETGVVSREAQWKREEFDNLIDARSRRAEVGRDEHGRTGLIYALCDNGLSIHVDESFQG